MILTQVESMTHIPDTNPEIQKTHTANTANAEEDHITEDNKFIKIKKYQNQNYLYYVEVPNLQLP